MILRILALIVEGLLLWGAIWSWRVIRRESEMGCGACLALGLLTEGIPALLVLMFFTAMG